MTVTESGMEMFTNFTQFFNAYLPMEVTESGIDTEVRCVLETLFTRARLSGIHSIPGSRISSFKVLASPRGPNIVSELEPPVAQ